MGFSSKCRDNCLAAGLTGSNDLNRRLSAAFLHPRNPQLRPMPPASAAGAGLGGDRPVVKAIKLASPPRPPMRWFQAEGDGSWRSARFCGGQRPAVSHFSGKFRCEHDTREPHAQLRAAWALRSRRATVSAAAAVSKAATAPRPSRQQQWNGARSGVTSCMTRFRPSC